MKTCDLFATLATEPNAEAGAIHPKAVPIILTTTSVIETWSTADATEALELRRPLPYGALTVVSRRLKTNA